VSARAGTPAIYRVRRPLLGRVPGAAARRHPCGRGAGPTARGRRLQPGADPYRADGVDQGLHMGERV